MRHVGVHWMQDQFDVKFPAEWSLEVEQEGTWKTFELYTTDRYDSRANQYNVVHPAAPLKCDTIRIRMTPKENAWVGILEVQVAFEEGQGANGARKEKQTKLPAKQTPK